MDMGMSPLREDKPLLGIVAECVNDHDRIKQAVREAIHCAKEGDQALVDAVAEFREQLYDGDAGIPYNYLVEPPAIDRTLGEYLCASGISSFAISETQKFGHVTYFWNGNNSGYIDEKLEKYVEIPSDRIAFDLRPWMKAAEITDQVIEAIHSGRYKFIRLNYANGDMVGHTGIPSAIRIAVATVDMAGAGCSKPLSWPMAWQLSRRITAMPTACGRKKKASVPPWLPTRKIRSLLS
jgi:hypothetical protein